jgi:hypothetical protein
MRNILIVIAAASALSVTAQTANDKLQSELLFDLVFEKGASTSVGDKVIVSIAGGTFEGPKLKGTVISPSADWIASRPDGSIQLDIRMLLQTDGGDKIYMKCRGIAYTKPDGSFFARIIPSFETSAAKYLWLNNVVAIGVYRALPGKIAYRVYQIL